MGLYQRKESAVWWMSYTVAGKQVRESTGTSDKSEAKVKLAERIAGKRIPVKGNVGKLRWIGLVCIQSLSRGDETDAVARECRYLLTEVEDRSAKSVQLPDHHAVELSLRSIGHEAIKGRAAGLGS